MAKVEIPEGIKAEMHGNEITIEGPLGSNKRVVNGKLLVVKKEGNAMTIEGVKGKRLAKKGRQAENSFARELRNDIDGVRKHFEIDMSIVFAHFPVSIEVKEKEVRINNMIGERAPRISKIAGSTRVEVKGQGLRVYGTSREDVGQTAANLRKAVRMRDKDVRVFQDGVYYNIE